MKCLVGYCFFGPEFRSDGGKARQVICLDFTFGTLYINSQSTTTIFRTSGKLGKNSELSPGCRFDLLLSTFKRQSIRPILDILSIGELVEAHTFLWDKLVELFYVTQEGEFRRESVTGQMVSSASYQRQQGCDLRLDYCKGVECIFSNPECAGNKVKNNMEVMAGVISRYLESPKVKDPGVDIIDEGGDEIAYETLHILR